jgi:hypothetical protein
MNGGTDSWSGCSGWSRSPRRVADGWSRRSLEISIIVNRRGPTSAIRSSEDGRREMSHLLAAGKASRPRRQQIVDDIARLVPVTCFSRMA